MVLNCYRARNQEYIVAINISKERYMFVVAGRFYMVLQKHMVDIPYQQRLWYMVSASMSLLKLKHHIHSSFEKSLNIERTIQYIKDRTEIFDDYFPCRKKNCKLKHIKNCLKLFAQYYNMEAISLTLQSLFYYVRL